jgi:acyl-CoA synthetase (NDP forming)/GNAT superfamily N-acetyltransferase
MFRDRGVGGDSIESLLMDGRIISIRHVRDDDEQSLLDLHRRVSIQSRYYRFFSAGVSFEPEVRRLLACADGDHVALLAEHDHLVIGVGSYVRLDDDTAEFALLVDDLWQDEGVGTLLVESLAAEARRAGIDWLVGDVLPSNSRMLEVGAGVAPNLSRRTGSTGDELQVRVPSRPDAAALAAAGLRDRIAERRSLARLLTPTTVAVIGASRRVGSVGHSVVETLLAGGFRGTIHPVNPHARDICGLKAYPSVSAVPAPVDLALVAVPARAAAAVVAQCAAAGVGAVVLLTASVTPSAAEEAAAEADLVRLARAHGMRIVGPNCLGLVNTDPAVRLTATFAPRLPAAGRLAVASQSGAVGIAILDAATRTGTGISSFVSLGNKADVSTNDLLAYWYDDPATSAVALYVESFGNPRRFAGLAQALAQRKPILAVKSGRSAGGRRAGASHTAAAAAPDLTVSTLFEQAGVIRTDTLGELLDAVRLLTSQPLPAGDRVGVVGNAGGLNVLAADAAQAGGLQVPELSPATQQAVPALPTAAGIGNPVDLGAEAAPAAMADAVRAVGRSGEVDSLVVTFVGTRANDVAGSLAALSAAVDDLDVPVLAVVVGVDVPQRLGHREVPVYALPEDAVRALSHACWYAAWRHAPRGVRPSLGDMDRHRARRLVRDVLDTNPGWQPIEVCRQLLAAYGIRPVPSATADSPQAARQAADSMGYPVALKAAAPDLVHKSDVGAVILDLNGPDAVADAYVRIADALDQARPVVLIQAMASAGVELAAGIVHDPSFGSVVSLRAGGTTTDLASAPMLRLVPVTDVDAGRMWRGLAVAPLLSGYRGRPPADTAALEDLVQRLGLLAEDVPEVAELDLNPVVVTTDGIALVDVKLRLAAIDVEADPFLRALSQPRHPMSGSRSAPDP